MLKQAVLLKKKKFQCFNDAVAPKNILSTTLNKKNIFSVFSSEKQKVLCLPSKKKTERLGLSYLVFLKIFTKIFFFNFLRISVFKITNLLKFLDVFAFSRLIFFFKKFNFFFTVFSKKKIGSIKKNLKKKLKKTNKYLFF